MQDPASTRGRVRTVVGIFSTVLCGSAAWGHGYNAGDVSITHPHQYARPSLQVASTGAAYRATLAGRGGKVVVQVPHKAAIERSH